ncbi:MAG: selenium metabolism-associated LysR family transcriptional regulator [Thermodesulfobacteriota bacterium]
MDVRRLEAFASVYELGSFSKAGQKLYLSQPTISAHIAALENELEVRLFDRLGRSVLPTQAADILYRHARETFSSLERARAEIALLREQVAGSLVLAGSTIPAHFLLPGIMARFSARYPDVSLRLNVGDSAAVASMVAGGGAEVGVVGADTGQAELAFEPLVEDELAVVVGRSRLAEGRAGLTLAELESMPWVMREPGSGTRAALESALAEAGLDLRALKVAAVVDTTTALLQCVRGGMGLAVTSRLAAAELIESGELAAVPAPGLSLRRTFYVIRHRQRHLFPVARVFTEFLKQECRGPAA